MSLRELFEGREHPAILSCRAHVPYDGCWWEPNYWLFKGGDVFPIYVSGKAYRWCGFDKLKTVHDIIMHGTEAEAFIEVMESSPDAYDTWELEEIEEIEPNPNSLNTMTVILDHHGLKGPVWHCDTCGKAHQGIAVFLGYTGNGGVGIFLSMPCCYKCFSTLRWCEGCFCTVIPTDEGVCPDCEYEEGEKPKPLNELTDEDNEAANFELDGSKFLAPGQACGPPPVIYIVQKRGGLGGDVR